MASSCRTAAPAPVTREAIEAQMNEIEADFRVVGRPGRTVYGVPFNEPYKDYRPFDDAR